LAVLVDAVVAFVSVRFDEVSPAVGEGDSTIVRIERARPNQSFAFEMSNAPPHATGIVAEIVQVALGYDPERADGGQHAALGAVDPVDAVALPHWPAFTPAW
jgi:hypothetical protein